MDQFLIEDESFADVKVVAGNIVWLSQTVPNSGQQSQINLTRDGARDLATKLLEALAA